MRNINEKIRKGICIRAATMVWLSNNGSVVMKVESGVHLDTDSKLLGINGKVRESLKNHSGKG